MTVLTDDKVNAETVTEVPVSDRRRPGRVQNVSAELIPLLRNQAPELVIDLDDIDSTAPLRGLFFAILLSVPLWIGIYYVASLLLSY